jgi:hypothetical protein
VCTIRRTQVIIKNKIFFAYQFSFASIMIAKHQGQNHIPFLH